MRRLIALTALIATAVPLAAQASPSSPPPDPTPGGPERPAEAFVPGTDNLDGLRARARRTPGTRSVAVTFDRRSRAADGGKPSAARRFVFLFDKSLRLRPGKFATCARELIEADGVGACPRGSKVGSGLAENFGIPGRAEVAVFNTILDGGRRGVLITIPQNDVILENTLERTRGSYRNAYRFALDEIVPPSPVAPAQRAATTRFQVTFGATRRDGAKRVGFVEASRNARPRIGLGLWGEFVTGQRLLTKDVAAVR